VTAGVIFDLDGVLIDSESLWYRAASQLLAEFGVAVTPAEYAAEWIANGKGPEHAVAKYGLPIDAAEFRRRRAPVVEHLVATQANLMPGVVACLERLSPRFRLVVATNSTRAMVEPVLAKHGLTRHFADLLTRERYARAKPEPDAFVAAAAALGLPAARCVVIEDAERGVLAARRAGTRIVAVPNEWTRGHDFSHADRVVGSLDDVTPELVDSLVARPA
jgi:HAD superfamily hydrolase (TIGR01509 family)